MNSSNPCAIDDEKLIQAVESKELLFNKGHHFYKNAIQKEIAWRAIAEECYASVDAAKKRWKILRDRFVRELRNYGKSKDDSGMVWERFEQLIFLRHHVNHKDSLLPLPIANIKIEDQHKPMLQQQQQLQQQQLSPPLQQQQQQHQQQQLVPPIAHTTATTAVASAMVAANAAAAAAGTVGYDTPVTENTVDTYDHTIKYMFSEDDGIQPEILEGDELLNEFLIRKKRDTSTSPTHSNGGGGGGADGAGGHKRISDAQLIGAIRSRMCLYEKGNANYKNITEKEKMWKQVADECGADSVRGVRSRWKQLRDRFGREIKSAQPSKSGWKLFEEMMFIKDHVNVRSSMLNAHESDERGGVKSELEDNVDAADCVYVDGQRLNVPRMIALIKNYPVIYDKSHRHYHNEARKEQAWESVAGDLQIDETALKTQWQALQDKYQRERKLAKKSNGVSQWPLLESLDFLKQSSKSMSKQNQQHRNDDAAESAAAAASVCTATTSATSSSHPNTNHNSGSNTNHMLTNHHQHHHAVVIVSAPSADNPHPEVVATYSTNVGHTDHDGNVGSMTASGSRKRRRDSGTTGDDGDETDGQHTSSSGGGLERKIERIVKRIVTRDGTVTTTDGATPQTYEEEFFSKFICEKLKSFPKNLRADAKSHIFQYLHELDNTLQ